jgi:hypothetical protein
MTDHNEQIDALAKAMSTIPGLDPTQGRTPVNAAVRRMWATELVSKWGVSIDPAKATVEAVPTAPALGNIGPHEVRDKATDADRMAANQVVRQHGPAFLAANTPDLAARLAAAKTQEQRDALAAELRDKILNNPNTLVTDFVSLLQDGASS